METKIDAVNTSVEWKASRYCVVGARKYEDGSGRQFVLVLSTRTGDLLVVPPEAAERLRDGVAPSCSDELTARLRRSELLVPANSDEFAALLDRNRMASRDQSRREFILFPTSYCNMGCTYCGQEHVKGSVGGDHRALVKNRILRAVANPRVDTVDVRWFGAEPMMGYATIIDVGTVAYEAARGSEVAYNSMMVTNGVLLTPRKVSRLRTAAGVRNYVISVDGPRGVHDARRPLKSGAASFDRILSNVRSACDAPGAEDVVFEIRTNVDEFNEDEVETFLMQAAEHGLARPRVFFHCMPVHTWSTHNDVSGRVLDWKTFAERELEWLAKGAELGLNSRLLPRGSKPVVCEAVTLSAEVINAQGGLFSCVAKPLVPGLEEKSTLAHIDLLDPAALRPVGPYDGWHETLSQGGLPCNDCTIFGVCGGACPKEWEENQIPCPSYREPANMQGRIHMAATAHGLRSVGAL